MTTIRPAAKHEFDQVVAVHSPAGRTESRTAQIRRWIDDGHCFVAEVDGRIVGYAALEFTFYEFGFVSLLLVQPEFRRQGLGSRLMQHAEVVCNTPKLFTSTGLSNLPMQGLLAGLHYTPSGVIHNLEPDDSELVYFKEISRAE